MTELAEGATTEAGTEDDRWPFAPHRLRLRLLTADGRSGRPLVDVVDPFLTLGDRSAFSRVLLGELVGPSNESVALVALKLQSDEYPVVGERDSAEWNNHSVEDNWRREVDLLERCGPAASGIPLPVEVLPRRRGETSHLPPTLLCKQRLAYFTACCPECGGPLADFRDSRNLEQRGLPRFDRSLVRFLACPACVTSGEAKLWTLVHGSEGLRADVGDQNDLFKAFARLAWTPATESPALPCQGCDRVLTCFPENPSARGDALRFLTPVTFYESECIALEPLPFRYDEFAALLGGASFRHVLSEVVESGRRTVLEKLERSFAGRQQFLFEPGSARFGLEVLRLKLTLFRQLCAAVATLHRHGGVPHLSLTPQRAMVSLLGQRTSLPNLWGFRLTLLGLGNLRPRVIRAGSSSELPTMPFAQPRVVDPIFAAAPVRAAAIADQSCKLTIRRMITTPDDRVVLEAELESDTVAVNEIGEKDTLDLSIVQGRPPLAIQFVATPVGMANQALSVRSVPLSLDAELRSSIEQVVGQTLTRARLTVYQCLHVPCDIFSLGKMLLMTLVGHPGQTQLAVSRWTDEVADRLTLFAHQQPDVDDTALVAQAASLMHATSDDGPFAMRNLVGHAETGEFTSAIPEALWIEALAIGVRATTKIPGFSLYRSYSDFDPGHPEIQTEYLLQLTDALVDKVDQALFAAPPHHREIREAIRRVAREFSLEPAAKVG